MSESSENILTLLVTGGAGFIGSNFVRHVLAATPETDLFLSGLRVLNLDALTYAGNPATVADLTANSRYTFVHGDITDSALLTKLFAEHNIAAVAHFAAESHVDRSIERPEDFLQTNVTGTFRLLEAARRHWTSLPSAQADAFRFLHVSTDEVYGTLTPDAPAFTEETAFAPNSPYAASKAASDHFARAYFHTYGLPVLTTNCSNNYGPFQFPEKLIPLMILNALEGKPLPIYGDGGNVRDWLFVGDHCRAIAGCLPRASRARPTTSADAMSAPTWRSSTRSAARWTASRPAPMANPTWSKKPLWRTAPATTDATPWTPPRSSANSTGLPPRPSRRAWNVRSAGTCKTAPGVTRSPPASTTASASASATRRSEFKGS